METILKATEMAIRAHAKQTRKNTGDPYILHPVRVAAIVAKAILYRDNSSLRFSGFEEACAIAAILHDTIEDTSVTYEQISQEFGTFVADLVQELTQDKKLPWAERRKAMIKKCATMSTHAKLIKLADRLDNMREMGSMERQFIERYCAEAREMVKAMHGVCPELEAEIMAIATSHGC